MILEVLPNLNDSEKAVGAAQLAPCLPSATTDGKMAPALGKGR